MNTFPCQCVEIRRQCGHQCLPLARLHLCNATIVQHSTTNYLHQIHHKTEIQQKSQLVPSHFYLVQAKLGTCTSKCRIPSVLLAASRTTAKASVTWKQVPAHQKITNPNEAPQIAV